MAPTSARFFWTRSSGVSPATEARVNIQLSELDPGRTASWHIHNGVVYFVVVRGAVTLEYEGRSEHYSAGDAYTEPIGVVHRALNPHPEIPAAFVGFWVTEPTVSM